MARYSSGKLIQSGRKFLSFRSRTSCNDACRITTSLVQLVISKSATSSGLA